MKNLQDIKVLVNDFYQKINDQQYIQTMLANHPVSFTKNVWSKDMAYSLEPLGLELLGFKGSKYLTKKPIVVKHLYEYRLIGDMIREVLTHDEHGQHTATDYLWREDDSVFEMQLDLNNNAYSLTEVRYDSNRPISSLRVDKNKGFWYHEYVYIDDRIKQIYSQQYNDIGSGGGFLSVEYIDDMVVNIYHDHHGKRYHYYKY